MDNRIKDLETIKGVFDKFGVKIILVYGALLGMVRDGKLIEHDDDIDLAVIDFVDHETRKKIGWTLFDLGFRPLGISKNEEIMFNVYGRMEPLEVGYNGTEESGIIVCERNFNFTIFFFGQEWCTKHAENEYVCTPKLGAVKLISTPAKFFKELGEIKIGGKKYLTPSPVKDYLDYTYFNNWKDKTDRRHGDTYEKNH